MLPINLPRVKGMVNSPKKESFRGSPGEDRPLNFVPQPFNLSSETIVVVVIPCGREDGKNTPEEMPYEIKIRKKGIQCKI